jgi:hypothetical protein
MCCINVVALHFFHKLCNLVFNIMILPFIGEGFDVGAYKQAPMIGVWSEDGRTIKLYAMKHCLIEEKCVSTVGVNIKNT